MEYFQNCITVKDITKGFRGDYLKNRNNLDGPGLSGQFLVQLSSRERGRNNPSRDNTQGINRYRHDGQEIAGYEEGIKNGRAHLIATA